MIHRIWTAYLVEIIKALRLRSTYLGPLLVILDVLGALFLHPIERDGKSDYAFIAYATPVALDLLGLLLVLVYCAGSISSELSSGTIRLLMVRPLRRWEFLVAKLMLGMTYGAVLTILVAGTSWSLAFFLGELAGVSYGSEVLYTAGEMRNAYLLGMALSLVPQFAVVAYATMLAAFTRNIAGAIGAAIGLWVFLDMVKYPLHINPFLFSSYLETPWSVFANRTEALDASWFPAMGYCALTSFSGGVLFVLVAVRALSRRNLHT